MKFIRLSPAILTAVDDADYKELLKYKWHAHKGGDKGQPYTARSERNGKNVKTIRMHRQIMNCPDGMEVDHLDGDRLNNTRSNLEIVTEAENKQRAHTRKF